MRLGDWVGVPAKAPPMPLAFRVDPRFRVVEADSPFPFPRFRHRPPLRGPKRFDCRPCLTCVGPKSKARSATLASAPRDHHRSGSYLDQTSISTVPSPLSRLPSAFPITVPAPGESPA